MAYTTRFGKPNMANLPPKLGKAIISQILNTPAPNRDTMHERSRNLEKEMVKIKEKENAEAMPADNSLCGHFCVVISRQIPVPKNKC